MYHATWNDELETSEITIEIDSGFKAIIIGNTMNMQEFRGYMYLFYTNDRSVSFPTIKDIDRRLEVVTDTNLTDDASYINWEK